ncbi:hypothetical protein [Roseateles paludis]|jgi:hypothetical protein|uniref:Uncharacterized protein n=1 Tax=Roseateles paludis TaxID=3145238 RepID=A0ABV0G392_9BURK
MFKLSGRASASALATVSLALSLAGLALPIHAADGAAQVKGEPRIEFTDSTPAKLGSLKRVAITNVVLEFQTKVFAEEITGRLSKMYLSRGNSYSDNVLAGFDAKRLEEAANRVYEKLKADLTAAGFEVVPEAELKAQPLYEKLRTEMAYPQGYHFGNTDGHSLVVGPTSLPIYLPPVGEQGTFSVHKKLKGSAQAPERSWGDNARMSSTSSYVAGWEVDLAKSLNAHLVRAWYLVGFGGATAATDWDAINTAHFSTTATSRTGASAAMYIREGQTRIAFRTPDGDRAYARESSRISALRGGYRAYDGDVVVRLDETLPGQMDFLAEGGVQKTEEDKPSGFLGMLSGAAKSLSGTTADNSYKTQVDPQRFADAAVELVGAVQPLLLAKVKR